MESIFAGHVNDMRNIIKEAFYRLTKNLGFAAVWEKNLSAPVIIPFCA
jgi:hypothetical protein